MKLTREFYKPPAKYNAKNWNVGGVVAEILVWQVILEIPDKDFAKSKYCAMAFSGKRSKPDFYFYFKTVESRANHINSYLHKLMAHGDAKKKRAEESKQPHTLKLGDILYSSWGYDQTNVDFYEVIRVASKRSIEIMAICSQAVEGSDSKVVPAPGVFTKDAEILTKRANHTNSVRMTSYACAYKWDGNPLYETPFGQGH